jgi:hypothetical protein
MGMVASPRKAGLILNWSVREDLKPAFITNGCIQNHNRRQNQSYKLRSLRGVPPSPRKTKQEKIDCDQANAGGEGFTTGLLHVETGTIAFASRIKARRDFRQQGAIGEGFGLLRAQDSSRE